MQRFFRTRKKCAGLTGVITNGLREAISAVIAGLREDYRETVAAEGLGRVIDVLADQRECLTAQEEEPVLIGYGTIPERLVLQ